MQTFVDPRETITAESFAIDPALLGLPLARPARRAAAMALDLVLIGLLVHAGSVLFGLAAAWVFWRVSGRSASGGLLRRSWRFTFRSLAALVLFVVAVSAWGSWREPAAMSRGSGPSPEETHAEVQRALERAGLSMPPGVPAVAVRDGGRSPEHEPSRGGAEARQRTDSLAAKYTAALEAGDSARAAELAPLVSAGFAADTVAALQARWQRVTTENRRLREQLDEAREDRGILAFLRASAEDLGLTLGWGGLYFTAFLALWSGQTPGKRMLRIRVVRLDGKPITWWASFERFGGYAASIFTGLLGFVQIAWDKNRQGMHDKITETVVVQQ